ncbi:MAG TPA: hypothetical protein VH572_05715 [Gaiella sp.]|jgi:hypothetical protein
MTASTLVFLTPWAGLVGLAFVLPLAALVAREIRSGRIRRALGLAPPGRARLLLRPLGIALVALLVSATAAQPALRDMSGDRMRTDAEIYLTFDVSRSMLASSTPAGKRRLDRALDLGRQLHASLRDVPTGVATLTTRMMPLLFPIRDERGVSTVLDHSVTIMQPPPTPISAPRASQLGAINLAAHRTYFSRTARKRALVVFGDLDTDFFGATGTLALLRRNRIEPFLVRVAVPGEQVFDASGRPEAYRSVSTLAVNSLRRVGWHAYEERQIDRVISDVTGYLAEGPTRPSGVVEAQRALAPFLSVAVFVMVLTLVAPSLGAGLAQGRRRTRRPHVGSRLDDRRGQAGA